MNVGVMALLAIGLMNIPTAGTCSPSDTLFCDSLKFDGGMLLMSGSIKNSIDSVNVAKYEPAAYLVSSNGETKLSCSKVSSSYNNHAVSLALDCPGVSLEDGQSVVARGVVETKQPYSDSAYYEEKQASGVYGKRVCSKDGSTLVCNVELEMKVPKSS
jgi:hypothetical protein